jgi:hypothetical protein
LTPSSKITEAGTRLCAAPSTTGGRNRWCSRALTR